MLKKRSIPFGYCMVNGKYALNAPEAEAVRKIFADYIGGKSLKTIAAEMQIPYNTGRAVWNKNMVCRVIENTKYIGEDGFPKIISDEDFIRAAEIKAERNTYRKPALQDKPQQVEIPITEYQPTDEIQRMDAILCAVNNMGPINIKRMGFSDTFVEQGNIDLLFHQEGLDEKSIIKEIKKLMRNKKIK